MNRRHACSFALSMFLATAWASAGNAQSRLRVRQPQFSDRPVCSEEASDTRDAGAAHLSFASYLRNETECGGLPRERLNLRGGDQARSDLLPPSSPEFSELDPVESELSHMGAAGYSIAGPRQHVLAILRENNACSAWYAQAQPDPAKKFSSLHFQIDFDGEDTATGEYVDFSVTYRDPWVARAQQDVGAGSTITLNLRAAFFNSRAPAKLRINGGGPFILQPPKGLHVEKYNGGSLNARVTTLLHEYGHIVGLLPIDRGEPGSAMLSTRNTDVVLDHCRKQIEASASRAVLLPLSLAALERNRR